MNTTTLLWTVLMTACTSEKNDTQTPQPNVTDSGQDSGTDEPEVNIWSGPTMIFTKAGDADHTDPANQDNLTELVVLTRGDRGSLYNVVSESSAGSSSPAGTEWAIGSTSDLDTLEFQTLKGASDNNMKDIPDTPLVLHLLEEDIYIDVTFLSWDNNNSGGGFSYERTTPTN